MGTILARRRADGSTAYMGKIIMKQAGAVIHRESQTFDRHRDAKAWLAKRETELRESGPPKPPQTLAAAIQRFLDEDRRGISRSRACTLEAMQEHPIGQMDCAAIRSQDIVAYAQALGETRQPQTVDGWMSELAGVFSIAGPAWGFPLDLEEMKAARRVMARLCITARSAERERRPSVEEMDRLMAFFAARAPQAAPMGLVAAFAMFSTRRQGEVVRIRWDDLEPGRVLVRDMKHPGGARGNHVWCQLTPEAEAIALGMPRVDERIFPYSVDAVQAAWTRACQVVGISDLRFHDLRHEGISRLFEMGWTIPQVAAVSGHRSWASLKRYAHLRHSGDRWAGWVTRR